MTFLLGFSVCSKTKRNTQKVENMENMEISDGPLLEKHKNKNIEMSCFGLVSIKVIQSNDQKFLQNFTRNIEFLKIE